MKFLLLQLSNLVIPAGHAANQAASQGFVISDKIGYIVLGVIVGPVFLLTIAAMIESPRDSRVPALFMGAFILLVSALVFGFAVIGIALKFIIPQ